MGGGGELNPPEASLVKSGLDEPPLRIPLTLEAHQCNYIREQIQRSNVKMRKDN